MNHKYILSLAVLAVAVGAAVFFVGKGATPSATVTTTADGRATARETGAPAVSTVQIALVDVGTAVAPDAGVRTAPDGYKGEGWHVSSTPSKEVVAAAVHTDAVLMLDAQQQQAAGSIPAAAVGAVVPSNSAETILSVKKPDSTH